jgi:nicotinamidase-related amidase
VSPQLAELADPGRCALCIMEMQRGVCGDLARPPMAPLVEAVGAQGTVGRVAALARAARAAGVPVVHLVAEFRADRRGSPRNAPLIGALLRDPEHLVAGTEATAVLPELGPAAEDLVVARHHGVAPFVGTDLDPTLRALRVETVVACGVSVNLGVLGTAIEAVDFGYGVVVPTDAVAGFPADYAAAVVERTLALVATRTTVAELAALWSGTGQR